MLIILTNYYYIFYRKVPKTVHWMVDILVSQVPGYLSHYHNAFFSMNFTWTTRLLLSGCWILSSTNLDDIRLSWQFASVVDAPSRNTSGHQLKSACLEKLTAIGWVRSYSSYTEVLRHCSDFYVFFGVYCHLDIM